MFFKNKSVYLFFMLLVILPDAFADLKQFNSTASKTFHPGVAVYDITRDTNAFSADHVSMIMQEVQKQTVAVDKISSNFSRGIVRKGCLQGEYGNIVCPEQMQPAISFNEYSEAASEEIKKTVIDKERGHTQTHTGTVRDFVDSIILTHHNTENIYNRGNAQTHTGTVRDFANSIILTHHNTENIYNRGSAQKHTKSVIDYTNKISSQSTFAPETISTWKSGTFTNQKVLFRYTSHGNFMSNTIKKSSKIPNNISFTFKGECGYHLVLKKSRTIDWYGGGYSYVPTLDGNSFSYKSSTEEWYFYPSTQEMEYASSNDKWATGTLVHKVKTTAKVCPSDGWAVNTGYGIMCKRNTMSCPSGYTNNGSNCKKTVYYDYYSYECPSGYSVQNAGVRTFQKTDPDNRRNNESTLDDNVNSHTPPANNCKKSLDSTSYEFTCGSGYKVLNSGIKKCPNGSVGACNSPSTANHNCYKDIIYNYYSYGCPSGYSVQNAGVRTFQKTDPDNRRNNESTLDDNVNSRTPPANNCKKSLDSTSYEFTCGSGYKVLNSGIKKCPNGSVGTCNSPSTANHNCYKDIIYNYYSYGCSPGYTTNNHGLGSCKKTDPDNRRNNESTLNDSCNSPTPPVGNCSSIIAYKYYKYKCDLNASNQGTIYEAIDRGIEVGPIIHDSNPTANNSRDILPQQKYKANFWEQDGKCFSKNNSSYYCVGATQRGIAEWGDTGCSHGKAKIKCWYVPADNSLNSPTPPLNNCKRLRYRCSDERKPAFVENEWKCSSFICNDGICALGICTMGNPQPGGTSYTNSPFNTLNTSTVCNEDKCDAFVYKKLGRCGSPSVCPKGFGVFSKNGNCYKYECPPDAISEKIGNEEFRCWELGCPAGYHKVDNLCEVD